MFSSLSEAEQSVGLNQIRKVKIDNRTICLTRTLSGFFAFDKDCPHMTDDLSKGKINNLGEVVCPWHAYRFNLVTGEEVEKRCKDLDTFPLIWESGLYLEI